MIPYGRQDITNEDIDNVIKTLKSDFLTQGPVTPRFEKSVSNYCNVKYAVAVNSATSALHISCMALGLSKGDHLWTSPISFVASANAAIYCEAEVDFVDIDYSSNNLCVVDLERKLIEAEKQNKIPKIVMPVHMAGKSCDMKKIKELSVRFGFKIIEDASHAIGGEYYNAKVGSCEYSDITVFSFHPVKIITTAEGGMALTNNQELYAKLQLLRSHGVTRDTELMIDSQDQDWYYEQLLLGYNYRMNDLQSALGLSQMKRLKKYVKKRNDIAKIYNENLYNLEIMLPDICDSVLSSFHLYIIKLKNNSMKFRNELFKFLKNNSVGVNLHYIPIYNHPFYKKMNYDVSLFPNAEKYYRNAISIPIHPNLSKDQILFISQKISEFFKI